MFACFKAIGKGEKEYWRKREVLSKLQTVQKGAALTRKQSERLSMKTGPVEYYARAPSLPTPHLRHIHLELEEYAFIKPNKRVACQHFTSDRNLNQILRSK